MNNTRFARWTKCLCVWLCLALLPVWLPSAQAASAPDVRIYLKRLNLTDRADLWLDGVYTAATGDKATMYFPRGSKITLQARDGEIYLFYQGMSICMGDTFTLIQNESGSDDFEGVRFAEGGNFYPGKLTFTVSGGVLMPVLTLSVEDYLLGVVPYEMSDSFPLEALKAQAVCARTYALAHISPDNAYDLVDTTADQVFKGIDPSTTNAIRAVRETAGVVGMYKGTLATCYYAASNGGQTELVEHVWSGYGDWGYYAMVDDPYDVENPESIVRRAKVNKDASGLPAAFVDIVYNYMAGDLWQLGYDDSRDSFRIDGIESITLASPRFDDPSRLYEEMTVTFTWSGRRVIKPATPTPSAEPTPEDDEIMLFASPTPSPTVASLFAEATPTATATPEPTVQYTAFEPHGEAVTLTLPIFPEVLAALNLSVYGADNELVTLTETETQFILESRRYGHGVGMSQRGAQWMAGQYGMTFTEILDFYYPGMELMKVQSGEAVLPTLQPQLAWTPAPPATPTPRPTLMPVTGDLPEGAYLATVANIDDDSSLNLRQEPSTASMILMRLYKHQPLVVLEVCEDPAWVHVRTDVVEGYVMLSFLEPVE